MLISKHLTTYFLRFATSTVKAKNKKEVPEETSLIYVD